MSFSSYFFWFCLILALGYKLSNVNATREGLAEENGGNESIDQNASRKIGVSSYDLNTHLQARNIAEGARPMLLVITFLAYPNLSKIQFESLDCSTEFDGRKYLR